MPARPKSSRATKSAAAWAENRAHSNRVLRWLFEANLADGKTRAQIAIDIADAFAAVDQIKRDLAAMLAASPTTLRGRSRAAARASAIAVWWSDELRYHVNRLHRNWPMRIEGPLHAGHRPKPSRSRPGNRSASIARQPPNER